MQTVLNAHRGPVARGLRLRTIDATIASDNAQTPRGRGPNQDRADLGPAIQPGFNPLTTVIGRPAGTVEA
jgi:hypothetical protein